MDIYNKRTFLFKTTLIHLTFKLMQISIAHAIDIKNK